MTVKLDSKLLGEADDPAGEVLVLERRGEISRRMIVKDIESLGTQSQDAGKELDWVHVDVGPDPALDHTELA